jgi:hypothetical protein
VEEISGWVNYVGGNVGCGSVEDFGNEALVLDEGVTSGQLRSTDCQLDECQRYPITDFFDNAGFAEYAFVHDNVMSEAVAVFGHSAPPNLWLYGFLDSEWNELSIPVLAYWFD